MRAHVVRTLGEAMSTEDGSDQSQSDQWFVFVRGQELGPFHLNQLLELLGKLPPDALLRCGDGSWMRPGELPANAPGSASTVNQASKPTADHKRNYFVRHWRGELSLPVSYWINGIASNLAMFAVVFAIASQIDQKENYRPVLALLVLVSIWALILAFYLWFLVGTWRSASNYSVSRRASYWGGIAKFFLVLGALRALVDITNTAIPQLTEVVGILGGDAKVGPHSFKVLLDGQELEFSGGITFGVAAELERLANTLPGLKTVHLNSQGGRIAEAAKMGALIKKKSLNTYVARSCLSACTIVFLNGKERFITNESRIGFHQPSFPGLSAADQRASIMQEEARLRALGVSPAFARKANSAAPNDMWIPSAAELVRERVATTLVSGNEYAFSGVSHSLSKDKFQAALDALPTFKAIRKIDLAEYTKLVDGLQRAVDRGQSIPEINSELSPIVVAVFSRILPHASDEHLLKFSDLIVRTTRTYNKDDPSACYLYLKTNKSAQEAAKVLMMRSKHKSLANEEDALQAQILDAYTGEMRPFPAESEITPLFTRLAVLLESKGIDLSTLGSEDNITPDKYARYCNSTASLFEEISRLPARDASTLLRFLLIMGNKK
jgi:hypothetical protein